MILTIDNLDGLGARDYSGSLDHSAPLALTRVLNAPSTVKAVLCLEGQALTMPVRRGRVVLASDAGTVLFTGYLTTEPVAIYAGAASEGAVYRLAVHAVSDEWMLDKAAAGLRTGPALAAKSGALVSAFAARAGGGLQVTSGTASGYLVGVFVPEAGASWSAEAGALAAAGYGSYRALNGGLTVASMPGATHALSDGDGSLEVAGLKLAAVRELANDVTLSGEMEGNAYWTEIFTGDGTTAVFSLTGEPGSSGGGKATLLDESFAGETIDAQIWQVSDPGSRLGLSADGLTVNGGNGFDGQTTLIAQDVLELAGTVTIELGNVLLNAGSAGVLAGLYSGAVEQANCTVGFNVRAANGGTVVAALVDGVEVGTPFAIAEGHRYTLRLRVHCAEMQRVKQSFYGLSESGAVAQFGGGLVDAPLDVVLEARDLGESSNTPVTVLYDGTIASSPAKANLAALNDVDLYGSIGSVRVARTGSAWVRSTNGSTGTSFTRLIGTSGEGVDCEVSSSVTGSVTFYAAREPAAGEHVTVLYRGRKRAVARMADAASLLAEAAGGGVGTARWLGKVTRPQARSSEDCEYAALAVLSASANRAAALAGSYSTINPATGDIWPGDTLLLTANGSTSSVIVRKVTVENGGSGPETLRYGVVFANEWAEGLSVELSEAIAEDAVLPPIALDLVPGPDAGDVPTMPVHALANLQGMTVIAVSGTAVQMDAGMAPPAGGGFEVRRRDGGFGTGRNGAGNGDLVLRSPVRGFTIPRAAFEESFFVRMYDGSSPPLYSRVSSAIVTHVPLG